MHAGLHLLPRLAQRGLRRSVELGATQLEVWRPACTSCGEHDACNSITRVCVCAEGCVLSNPATCVPDPGYQTSCSGHGSCEPFTGACICENA